MNIDRFLWMLFGCSFLLFEPVVAQEFLPFREASSAGVAATRGGNLLKLRIEQRELREAKIPRLAAALRKASWGEAGLENITLRPEQDHWILKWSEIPEQFDTIILEFGSEPKLLAETHATRPQPDGSFYLPAHMASTHGEKIRYEPQSYKNTVGYWVGSHDSAQWQLGVDRAGKFNVAILQGCGQGQGGSEARILMKREGQEDAVGTIDFEVEETGHFQNFHWRTIGEVELQAGLHSLTIQPLRLANRALMDVRAVHLVRLPAPAGR